MDIHVSFGINCNNFDDPLTFNLAPPSGWNFKLSNTLIYYQKPAKLTTFPSASADNMVNIIPAKYQRVSIVTVRMLANHANVSL